MTQYELWKSVWSSIKDRNLFELDWTLRRHNEPLARFTPQTLVGNRDVTRIASTLGAGHAVTAAAILLAVGGTPSIYAGDEQAFTGVKEERVGGDDAVRPAFPERPEARAHWASPSTARTGSTRGPTPVVSFGPHYGSRIRESWLGATATRER